MNTKTAEEIGAMGSISLMFLALSAMYYGIWWYEYAAVQIEMHEQRVTTEQAVERYKDLNK